MYLQDTYFYRTYIVDFIAVYCFKLVEQTSNKFKTECRISRYFKVLEGLLYQYCTWISAQTLDFYRLGKLATCFQEVAQMCLRISKILFFGQVFLCGLETPVLKLQKSETGVSEYVSVVEASSTSLPSSPPTQVRGNCRKSSPFFLS